MRVCVVIVAVCAWTASFESRAAAQVPTSNVFSAITKGGWDEVKRNIRDSADQMPEADYGFKPVDSVRTFGQILAHVAGASYEFCSAAKGEKSPFSEDHFEKAATTKAAILKALDAAIAYCDGAYAPLTDAGATETISMPFGMGKSPRIRALLMNVGHFQEHYGNLVTYLRIKGQVPPTSRR